MTVRVNKSSFNIREKLSELERPIGLKGSELMRAETAQEARDFVSAGRKNLIINGDMRIDQRNNGTLTITNTGALTYRIDRWAGFGSVTSKFSLQQSSTAPPGFVNSLLATSLSAYSVSSSQIFKITQVIEGFNTADLNWGTANAKTVTLSFWVRSSLTGTFGGSFFNSSFNRNYPFSYTISAADTWEYKTVTVNGDTTGTWLTTNGIGVQIAWSLGAGATISGTAGIWATGNIQSSSGSTSVVGTSGATFYITGVQLEVGKNATEFEHRSYGEELALCQRYYQQYGRDGSGSGRLIGSGNGSSTMLTTFIFPQAMRTNPTPNYFGGSTDGGSFNVNAGTTATSNTGASYASADTKSILLNFSGSSSHPNSAYWIDLGTGTNQFGFTLSAEL